MYFVFILFIIVSYIFWNKKNHTIVVVLFSAIIGLIYSKRSLEVGNDTESYLWYFKTVTNKYIVNPFLSKYEPVYHFIISNSPTFSFYLFITSFLTVLLISLTFKSKKKWLSAFLFLSLFGFFNVLTDQGRQLLGVGVLLFFLSVFKYKKTIFAGLLASLVHLSNLIVTPFILLFNYIDKKKIVIPNYVYLSLLFGALIIALNKYWHIITYNVLSLYAPDSGYLAERFYDSTGSNDGYGLMYYRLILAILLLALFLRQKKMLGFNLIFSGLFMQISSIGFMPIERLGVSMFFIGLVIFSNSDLYSGPNKSRKIVIYLYAIIYFIQTNIMNVEKHGSVPWMF